MTTLRQQMDNAMVLRGFAERTRESYLAAVTALAKHYHRSPDLLTSEEVQAYLLHLIVERKLAYASVNQAACACRFLFGTTLKRPLERFDIPLAKVPKNLPRILAREEVSRLFAHTANLRARDRYTMLSPALLATLREYWRVYRPATWLFPNPSGTGPIDHKTAQRLYCAARDRAGLGRQGGIHTLRHCFATHLLESGVDIHTIQRLLGHGHVSTTMRYFHLAHHKLTGTTSPLELLDTVLR